MIVGTVAIAYSVHIIYYYYYIIHIYRKRIARRHCAAAETSSRAAINFNPKSPSRNLQCTLCGFCITQYHIYSIQVPRYILLCIIEAPKTSKRCTTKLKYIITYIYIYVCVICVIWVLFYNHRLPLQIPFIYDKTVQRHHSLFSY